MDESDITIHLTRNFQEVFGIEANFQPLVTIGHNQFLFGRTCIRCIHRQDQSVFVQGQLYCARAF